MIPHVIDGEARKASDGRTFPTVDPWTQAPWEEAALGSREDVDAAVAAARRAFAEGPWPRMGTAARGAVLHRLAGLIEAHTEELAEADTSDMGKPLGDMRGKDVPRAAAICREEVFGPVVTVSRFTDEAQAVALANDSPYGLNAMLFTENVRRAHRVAAKLRAGTVWVNCFFVRDLRAPFGGVGDSGIGREGGDFSREFCTEPKAVVMEI